MNQVVKRCVGLKTCLLLKEKIYDVMEVMVSALGVN